VQNSEELDSFGSEDSLVVTWTQAARFSFLSFAVARYYAGTYPQPCLIIVGRADSAWKPLDDDETGTGYCEAQSTEVLLQRPTYRELQLLLGKT
jgi:hypothetical protein